MAVMSSIDPDSVGHDDRAGGDGLPPSGGDPAVPAPKTEPAPARTSDDQSWFETRPRQGRNYSAAVYGSVLAATVVISAGDLRAPLTLVFLLLSSGVVFWLAHVYAATVAGVHGGWQVGSIRTAMKHEWPVAFAAVPPALAALVSALVTNVSVTDGVWAALVICIVEQQLWGLAAVRNANIVGVARTRTMLLNLFVGGVIVALKLAIGH